MIAEADTQQVWLLFGVVMAGLALVTALYAWRKPLRQSTVEELQNLSEKYRNQQVLIEWLQRQVTDQSRRLTEQEHELSSMRQTMAHVQEENAQLRLLNAALSKQLSVPARRAVKTSTLLRKTLSERLNEAELRTLAADLGISYDDLPGDTVSVRAMELLAYCERHDRVDDLLEELRASRPDIGA